MEMAQRIKDGLIDAPRVCLTNEKGGLDGLLGRCKKEMMPEAYDEMLDRIAAADARSIIDEYVDIYERIVHDFKPGDFVIYLRGREAELGQIKRITDDGAFVWYHSGYTAAKTNFRDMYKVQNSYLIVDTLLGGEDND